MDDQHERAPGERLTLVDAIVAVAKKNVPTNGRGTVSLPWNLS